MYGYRIPFTVDKTSQSIISVHHPCVQPRSTAGDRQVWHHTARCRRLFHILKRSFAPPVAVKAHRHPPESCAEYIAEEAQPAKVAPSLTIYTRVQAPNSIYKHRHLSFEHHLPTPPSATNTGVVKTTVPSEFRPAKMATSLTTHAPLRALNSI